MTEFANEPPDNPYQHFVSPAELSVHLMTGAPVDWQAVATRAAEMEAEQKEGAGLLGVFALQQHMTEVNSTASSAGAQEQQVGQAMFEAASQVELSAESLRFATVAVRKGAELAAEELANSGRIIRDRSETAASNLRPVVSRLEDVMDPAYLGRWEEIASSLANTLQPTNIYELRDVANNLKNAAQITQAQRGY